MNVIELFPEKMWTIHDVINREKPLNIDTFKLMFMAQLLPEITLPPGRTIPYTAKEALLNLNEKSVQIKREFNNGNFQLLLFESEYHDADHYAFAGSSAPKYNFHIMNRREIKPIAQPHMDELTYKSWFWEE